MSFSLVALTCAFKIEAKKARLVKVAENISCGRDETLCPAGCCPSPNWHCCPLRDCAPTASECPDAAKRVSLVKMAMSKQCDPDEIQCPGGCCPVGPNWEYSFCCPDQEFDLYIGYILWEADWWFLRSDGFDFLSHLHQFKLVRLTQRIVACIC